MTSIILMLKFTAMKLDKARFDTIKTQQADINQKKRKAINALKVILDQQAPKKPCRLCLRPGGTRIFGGDQEFDVALNIISILGIEITEDDGRPQHVCGSCERTLRCAAKLRQTAETTQWRLQQEQDLVSESACVAAWSDDERLGARAPAADVGEEVRCGKCRASFNNQEQFAEHQKRPCSRVKLRTYVCESCGLELKTMSRLKRHRLTHSGALPYPCSSCPYRARTRYALGVHAHAHSGARPQRCPHCAETFANSSNFVTRLTHSGALPYPCSSCPYRARTRYALGVHAHAHSGARPQRCPHCAETFANSSNFVTRLTHSGALPYPCSSCPYRARTRYALGVHAHAHSGARPQRCPHCAETFANSSNLASHRRKHLPPRYHCQACQKGFKFKVALHNHMATQHSNAKPYVCNICAKAFSTRKMILRHELKAHNRPKMRSGVLPSYMRQEDNP